MSPPRTGFSSENSNSWAAAGNSNSSWAEMELDVIGHFDVWPLTWQVMMMRMTVMIMRVMMMIWQVSQIYILRLLTPLAEYQDFIALTQGTNILEIIER